MTTRFDTTQYEFAHGRKPHPELRWPDGRAIETEMVLDIDRCETPSCW